MSNSLVQLKEKLMIKPQLSSRKEVIVRIGEKEDSSEKTLIIDDNPPKGIMEKRNNTIRRDELLKNIPSIVIKQNNIEIIEPSIITPSRKTLILKKKPKIPIKIAVDIENAMKVAENIIPDDVNKKPKAEEQPLQEAEQEAEQEVAQEVEQEVQEAEQEQEVAQVQEAEQEQEVAQVQEAEQEQEAAEKIPDINKKPKIIKIKRITKAPVKGVAVLGAETNIQIGDTDLQERMPQKTSKINIYTSNYYMNNREIFINFINSLFRPYKEEIEQNQNEISCDDIGNTGGNFSLLTHQKIVRDYINLFTPYRGLLLYHGLGSGKTCTSIAIAEGMKHNKRVIVLLPASLRANYIEELKKCGDILYKRNQYWEWISIQKNPMILDNLSAALGLPVSYIEKNKGAWLINIKKASNYHILTDNDKKSLENQLNMMIQQKYQFINYNGLRTPKLKELTDDFAINPFDNSVVIIDEAHNLISRIVNKIKTAKNIKENKRGEKEHLPIPLSLKLYEYLLSAQNAKIILLTGTPVINYPSEFAILFNILRGYIKTWRFVLDIKTNKKIDKNTLYEMLGGQKTLDYLDYSASSKTLTITRNPFGFLNKIRDKSYDGVMSSENYISEDIFEKRVVQILRENDILIIQDGIEIQNKKALPDNLEIFQNNYIDFSTGKLKNIDALKRRIVGLSSFFRSAQENLLPRYNKEIGVDYFIISIPMSDYQFKKYESARIEERKTEKFKPNKTQNISDDLYKDNSSTYRIFSRLFCNYVMPDRPMPNIKKTVQSGEEKEKETNISELLKEGTKISGKADLTDDQEGEIEGDQILDNIGGIDYKQRLNDAISLLKEHSEEYLSKEALVTYSPKFLHIYENIVDPDHIGLHLVYSQFRTAEGIGIFSLVLDANGFTRFKIKQTNGIWQLDISLDTNKPTYALYTGTETSEEKEILRHIYNGEWSQIPDTIREPLQSKYANNDYGEVIKVLMITSSGSEGINLRNTRYVHIMEPYWHPVRLEQVIGRARRICSHKNLPPELQTVSVYIYLMSFRAEQLASDEAIELKRHDLSKGINSAKVPITSDQYLYEISQIKENVTMQLTDAIKESSFDCNIYSGKKCFNFGETNNMAFSYVPDYANQQADTIVRANKRTIEWRGVELTIGNIKYVYREMREGYGYIYDYDSYQNALINTTINPIQIGTLEIKKNGEYVFTRI
jgi:flagellar motor protein MotB